MGRPLKTRLGRPSVFKGQERVWWRGRWHHLGPEGSKEAQAEYGRLAALWASDPTAEVCRADRILIGELVADFFDANPDARSRSKGRIVRATKLLLSQHLSTEAASFRPMDLFAWLTWLGAQTRAIGNGTEPRYTREYIQHLHKSVIGVFRWGVSTGRVPGEVLVELETVDTPKRGRPSTPRMAADAATIERVVRCLPESLQIAVRLQLHTGARPSEVLKLRPCDIHRTGRVPVPGAGTFDVDAEQTWLVVPSEHKAANYGRVRMLMIGPTMQAELLPLIGSRGDADYLFRPVDNSRREADALQPFYSSQSFRQAIKRACVRAGVAVWTPYQLRHLAAEQIDETHGETAVQEFLGHSSPAVTAKYRKMRAAAKRIAGIARGRGA